MGAKTSTTPNCHHTLPAHEVVLLLETDPHQGLDPAQAAERLDRFGPNALPAVRGAGLLVRILRQFHHPLIYVLLVAAAVTAALREFVDSAVIMGVVVINAVVGFIQEYGSEKTMQALRRLSSPLARVLRGGYIVEVGAVGGWATHTLTVPSWG